MPYEWRRETVRIVRAYPTLAARKEELSGVSVTPSYDGIPGGGSATRTTEDAALRSALLPEEEWMLCAVEDALAALRYFSNAALRAKMVELLYFRARRWSLARFAERAGVSFKTAQSWNNDFLHDVWSHYLANKKRRRVP